MLCLFDCAYFDVAGYSSDFLGLVIGVYGFGFVICVLLLFCCLFAGLLGDYLFVLLCVCFYGLLWMLCLVFT